jgi:hypothetical protein
LALAFLALFMNALGLTFTLIRKSRARHTPQPHVERERVHARPWA